MSGEKNLQELLKNIHPVLNEGEYVFCTAMPGTDVSDEDIIGMFKEKEGSTIILKKQKADELKLGYTWVAAWITLQVHSSLAATGFTAAFATALAGENIGCNVVAAYYHDHIFTDTNDAEKAMSVLKNMASAS